jgi:hypothetical protein
VEDTKSFAALLKVRHLVEVGTMSLNNLRPPRARHTKRVGRGPAPAQQDGRARPKGRPVAFGFSFKRGLKAARCRCIGVCQRVQAFRVDAS